MVDCVEADDRGDAGQTGLEAGGQVDVAGDHDQSQTEADGTVHGGVTDNIVEAGTIAIHGNKGHKQHDDEDQDGVIVLERPHETAALFSLGGHYFLFHSLTPFPFRTSRDRANSMIAPMTTHWRYWDICRLVKPAESTP